MATPTTWGSSQARGQIGAEAVAYTTATAMPDRSRVCELHHCSWKRRILNPLSEVRDRTHSLMVPSRIRFRHAMLGTPSWHVLDSRSHLLASQAEPALGVCSLTHILFVQQTKAKRQMFPAPAWAWSRSVSLPRAAGWRGGKVFAKQELHRGLPY